MQYHSAIHPRFQHHRRQAHGPQSTTSTTTTTTTKSTPTTKTRSAPQQAHQPAQDQTLSGWSNLKLNSVSHDPTTDDNNEQGLDRDSLFSILEMPAQQPNTFFRASSSSSSSPFSENCSQGQTRGPQDSSSFWDLETSEHAVEEEEEEGNPFNDHRHVILPATSASHRGMIPPPAHINFTSLYDSSDLIHGWIISDPSSVAIPATPTEAQASHTSQRYIPASPRLSAFAFGGSASSSSSFPPPSLSTTPQHWQRHRKSFSGLTDKVRRVFATTTTTSGTSSSGTVEQDDSNPSEGGMRVKETSRTWSRRLSAIALRRDKPVLAF